MIKLRLIQPGLPDQVVTIEGSSATIGRSADCDLTIQQPYVSKRHAMVLQGTIVVDIGSRNGTFVAGNRIVEPTVIESGAIQLGDGDALVEVVRTAQDAPAPLALDDADATLVAGVPPRLPAVAVAPQADAPLARDLEELRARSTELEMEVQRLRRELGAARDTSDKDAVLDDLTRENADLRRRLASLKSEVEDGAQEGADSVQARLAREELEKVRARNEKLAKRIAELESPSATTDPRGAAPPPAAGPVAADPEAAANKARVETLEKEARDHLRNVRRLEEELAQTRARLDEVKETPAPEKASDLFFRLQKENGELRKKVDELERSGTGKSAPELFFKLQAENLELRNRVAALESAPAPTSGPDPKAMAELARARQALEAQVIAQAAEIQRLAAQARQIVPAAPPPPLVPPALPAISGGANNVMQILHTFVDHDVDSLPQDAAGPAADFLFTETLRYLRQVERVVTRMAGDFIQLYELNTMLPDMESNFRGLVTDVLASPTDGAARRELVRYLEEMRKWLVVSLGAHRRAAARFADELKVDLTERGLTTSAPIPRYKKLAGHDAELWKRTREYMNELTPEVIEDRLEKLARESAQDLLSAQRDI